MTAAGLKRFGLAWVAAGALALGAAGCAGPRYVYFRPAGAAQAASPEWIAQTDVYLPPEVGAVEVTVAVRGVVHEKKGQVPQEGVQARMTVSNRGDQPFSIDPAQMRLLDDDGRMSVGATVASGAPATGPITAAPGEQKQYELSLDLPPGTQFAAIGSFRLEWPYRYGNQDLQVGVKFLKVDEVEYYYPAYRDPWYDPWYGPHYYAYPWWGHINFSLGYTYHHHGGRGRRHR